MRGENMSVKRPWSRNRIESIVLLIVVIIMTFQLSSHFGGELPDFDETDLSLAPSQPGFLNRLADRPSYTPSQTNATWQGASNPFFTDYFTPPPEPLPPPKPTTKEVTILFHGWFESSQGQLQAFVSLDGKKAKGGVKDAVGENLTIEAIEAGQLIVKSADEIQHTIPFKKPTKITTPLP